MPGADIPGAPPILGGGPIPGGAPMLPNPGGRPYGASEGDVS